MSTNSTALSGTVEDIEDAVVIVEDSGSALATLNSSEIFQQIATAKKYPRSLTQFMKQLGDLATVTEEVAQQCIYALPRGGKRIVGKSIRMAELVLSCWKNVRAGYRIVAEDDRFITCQGYCYDLENNVFLQAETRRRITNREGKKYDDDMIAVTGAAGCSIAMRNAVLRVVPPALIEPIFQKCLRLIKGDEKTLTSRIDAALGWFKSAGASEDMVLKSLGRAGRADITSDDLVTMTGMKTAVTTGEQTIEQMFDYETTTTKKSQVSPLNDKIGKSKQPPKQTPEPQQQEPLTPEQSYKKCLADVAPMSLEEAQAHIRDKVNTDGWDMQWSLDMDKVLEGKAGK